MSDSTTTRKPRSPINAFKVLNILRTEKGLPPVKRKLPNQPTKLSREERTKLTAQIWQELFPDCLKDNFVLPEGAEEKVLREYAKRTK